MCSATLQCYLRGPQLLSPFNNDSHLDSSPKFRLAHNGRAPANADKLGGGELVTGCARWSRGGIPLSRFTSLTAAESGVLESARSGARRACAGVESRACVYVDTTKPSTRMSPCRVCGLNRPVSVTDSTRTTVASESEAWMRRSPTRTRPAGISVRGCTYTKCVGVTVRTSPAAVRSRVKPALISARLCVKRNTGENVALPSTATRSPTRNADIDVRPRPATSTVAAPLKHVVRGSVGSVVSNNRGDGDGDGEREGTVGGAGTGVTFWDDGSGVSSGSSEGSRVSCWRERRSDMVKESEEHGCAALRTKASSKATTETGKAWRCIDTDVRKGMAEAGVAVRLPSGWADARGTLLSKNVSDGRWAAEMGCGAVYPRGYVL